MDINIDEAKLRIVMEFIDEIAKSNDADRINELEARLRELTGRADINAADCFEYWSWTSLEDLARTFLTPDPVKQGLDDDQLADIIKKLYNAEYDQAETSFHIDLLKKETGISNISDYIYWPDQVGLDRNADETMIIAQILADKIAHSNIILL